MDASLADLFCFTNDGTRPVRASLIATKAIGASFLQTDGLTGWTNESAIHFTLFQVDNTKLDAYGNPTKIAGTQSDWKAIKNGANLEQLVLKAGTDNNYPAGSVVVCAPTSAWADDLMGGLSNQHNKQGGHTNVTATTVTSSGLITAQNGFTMQSGTFSAPDSVIPFNAIQNGTWKVIGRKTLNNLANVMTLTGLPVCKYLQIHVAVTQSGTTNQYMIFNNDRSNSYAWRRNVNNDADQTVNNSPNGFEFLGETNEYDYHTIDVTNVAGQMKIVRATRTVLTSNSLAVPNRYTLAGVWGNTSDAITRVDYATATGNFAAGSELIVWGYN